MNFEQSYDVIIVGAGPAGSTAAYYAAKGGLSVLLVDKKKDLGSPLQCGGFLPCLDELHELLPAAELPETLESIPDSIIHTTTKYHRFISPTGDTKEFKVEASVLDRRRFDKHLAKLAAKQGAHLSVGTKVLDVDYNAPEGVDVTLKDISGTHTINAKVIIGADGPHSMVAKKSGLLGKPDPMGRAHAIEYELSGVNIDTEAVEMYFGRDYVPGGYAWIISQGGDTANIGVGIRKAMCEPGMTIRDYLERFMHEHPVASKKLEGATITAIIAGVVPVGGAPPTTCTDNTIITGDAAGHLITTNGGGIPTAMVGGKTAGECAVAFINGTAPLTAYEKRWRQQMGSEIATSLIVRKLMDTLMRSDSMMTSAIKMIPEEHMKALQRGRLPGAVKKLLEGMNAGFM